MMTEEVIAALPPQTESVVICGMEARLLTFDGILMIDSCLCASNYHAMLRKES